MATFMQELGAVRETVLKNAELIVQVTGSKGQLAVRFKSPADETTRDRMTGIVAIYRADGALSRVQELQLVVDLCDEILRRGENGEWETIEQDGATGPLRFDASDPRWEGCDTALECVEKLYNLDVKPLAVAGMADFLVDWLQGVDVEVQSRVEGKSEAAEAAES